MKTNKTPPEAVELFNRLREQGRIAVKDPDADWRFFQELIRWRDSMGFKDCHKRAKMLGFVMAGLMNSHGW